MITSRDGKGETQGDCLTMSELSLGRRMQLTRSAQIPTPRWSTYDAKKVAIAPLSGVPTTQQERAWSSPIRYTPTDAARQSAARGMTVTELEQKGGVALDDAQLKQLVVGQTLKVRNTATGQRFEILYGRDGRRVITSRDGKGETLGDRLTMSELSMAGQSAAYEIRDGTSTLPRAVTNSPT